jgi:hypothetical protein
MTSPLVAEFDRPEPLAEAIRALRARGYQDLDALTPYPSREIEDALGMSRSPLAWIVFACALGGALCAYLVQWVTVAVLYPVHVGGRPAHAPPAFVPITFETAVLAGALAALVGFFLACRLPQLYHPLADLAGFEQVSVDRFWLYCGARDGLAARPNLTEELRALGATAVRWLDREQT